MRQAARRSAGAGWRRRGLGAALVAGLALARPAAAQVLPPIYRPLPTEEQDRFRVQQRTLRDSAAARRRAADTVAQVAAAVPGVQQLVLDFEKRAGALRAIAEQHRAEALVLQDSSRRVSLTADSLSEALGRLKGRRDSLEAAPLGPPADSARGLDSLALARLRVRDSTERSVRMSALVDSIRVEQVRKDSLRLVAMDIRDLAVSVGRDAMRDQAEAARIAADAERLATSGNESIVRLSLERSVLYERAAATRFLRMVDSLGRMLDSRQRLADRRWFPIRAIDDSKLYYGARGGRLGYFRGATATYDNRRGASANVDLFEYYVDHGRLSWTIVWNERGPASDTSTARSALDRFLLGGGDLALTFMTPFVFQRGDGWSVALSGDVRGAMSLSPRGAFPLFDQGLLLYGGFTQKLLGELTFALRAGGIRHDSDIIGRITGTGSVVHYGQLTAGWELHNLLKVVVSRTTGPTIVQRQLAYTIQFKI
ncbi:MAG: hypothetical protein ACK5Z1_02510 [Gemmatimonadota bacterium]